VIRPVARQIIGAGYSRYRENSGVDKIFPNLEKIFPRGWRSTSSQTPSLTTFLRSGVKCMSSKPVHNFRGRQSQSVAPSMEISTCMRSAADAISPLVDNMMMVIKGCCPCAAEQEEDVEMALREALANAVLHGNQQDAGKRVYVHCRLELCGELSVIIRDEGTGFDPNNLADPVDSANLTSTHGRGIYLMRALMDDVRFEQGGTEVHMRKSLSRRNGNHR